jgi:hypothetical protein
MSTEEQARAALSKGIDVILKDLSTGRELRREIARAVIAADEIGDRVACVNLLACAAACAVGNSIPLATFRVMAASVFALTEQVMIMDAAKGEKK